MHPMADAETNGHRLHFEELVREYRRDLRLALGDRCNECGRHGLHDHPERDE